MINRIGVYSIGGSVFTAGSTITAISERINTMHTGSVVSVYPSEDMQIRSGSEILNFDAFWSGTVHIDDFATENLFYRKTSTVLSLRDSERYNPLRTEYSYYFMSGNDDSRWFEQLRGHSFGMTSNRSTANYAVLSVITGSLADELGTVAPNWFLSGNGVGTPYVPDSSMSLGNIASDEIDAQASADLLNQTVGQSTLIPNANTLTDYLNREGYTKTTEQLWQETINSQ